MENTNTPQEEIQYFKDKTKQVLQGDDLAKILTKIKLKGVGLATLSIILLPIMSLLFVSKHNISFPILLLVGIITILLLVSNMIEKINTAKEEILEKSKLNKQELIMLNKILHSFELLDNDCKTKIICNEISEDGISLKNIEPIIKALNEEKIESVKKTHKISIAQNVLNLNN